MPSAVNVSLLLMKARTCAVLLYPTHQNQSARTLMTCIFDFSMACTEFASSVGQNRCTGVQIFLFLHTLCAKSAPCSYMTDIDLGRLIVQKLGDIYIYIWRFCLLIGDPFLKVPDNYESHHILNEKNKI